MTILERIAEALRDNNESLHDIVANTLSPAEMESTCWNNFHLGYLGGMNIWTKNHVYFVVDDSDDGHYIQSVPRNPPTI